METNGHHAHIVVRMRNADQNSPVAQPVEMSLFHCIECRPRDRIAALGGSKIVWGKHPHFQHHTTYKAESRVVRRLKTCCSTYAQCSTCLLNTQVIHVVFHITMLTHRRMLSVVAALLWYAAPSCSVLTGGCTMILGGGVQGCSQEAALSGGVLRLCSKWLVCPQFE